MKNKNYLLVLLLLIVFISIGLSACGTKASNNITGKLSFDDLKTTGSMELKYAKQFSVDYYGDYKLITIHGDEKYFVVPSGKDIPDNIPKDITVINQDIENTYLVSTSVMDLMLSIGAEDKVSLVGTKSEGWYIEEAKKLIDEGKCIYAGKYSAPDYELILQYKCDLAIENTMIYHNPEVKEKLEEFGIPVLVEYSSYEEHPLGRMEWIRLYGLLYGREEEANSFFDKQLEEIEPIMEMENTGLKVAFFYITGNGAANVRKPNDYIAKMINLAGGEYVFTDMLEADENALSTLNMQMEDFYAGAKDADVIIYNSTIDGELSSLDELLEKSSLLADFKAVKNNRVYCTGKNFFQESTGLGQFMLELNKIFEDDDCEGLKYIYKLK